jgi:hypothetical protein
VLGGGQRELNAKLDNRGYVLVEHDLFVTGEIANAGVFQIYNNKTLWGNPALVWKHRGGLIVDAGTISLAGGSTLELERDFTPDVFRLNAPNLTVNGPGKLLGPPTGEFVIRDWLVNAEVVATGNLKVQGNVTFNNGLSVAQGKTLRVAASDFGSATVRVNKGLENRGTIDLTNESVSGYGATLEVSSGALTNVSTGVIRALQGVSTGPRSLIANLDNRGRLEIEHDLSLTGDIANQGTIHLAGGKILTASPALTLTHRGGAITGPGTLSLAGNSTFVLEENFTPGTFMLEAPQLTVNGPGKFLGPTEGEFVIRNWLFNAEVIATGDLKVQGNVTFNNGLTVDSGNALRVAANNLGSTMVRVNKGLENRGTIDLTNESVSGYGAALEVASGALTNVSTGVIRALLGVSSGPRSLIANLDNRGRLEIEHDLSLTGNIAHQGTIHLAGGKILTVSPALTWTHRGGAITGLGTLSLAGNSTFVLEENFTPGRYILEAPQLTVNGPGKFLGPTEGEFVIRDWLVNAEVVATGGLKVLGNVTFNSGLTVSNGKILRVAGNNTVGPGTLTVINGLENQGTIELLTEGAASYGATLVVSNGDFFNAPGGLVRTLQGPVGASRTLSANLDNAGELNIMSGAALIMNGTLLNRTSGILSGRGILDITAAVASNEGFVSPGVSPGILTVNGNLTWTDSAIFDVELGGLTAGLHYDRLVLNSSANLNGTIRPRLINDFLPKKGDIFNVLTFPSRTGSFSQIDNPGNERLAWEIRYTETSAQLVVLNTSPTLDAISNQTVNVETLLSIAASAKDQDLPAQTLTYSLDTAPTGMTINPATGQITWKPTVAQGPGSYNVTVRVADNIEASLSATSSFVVTVNAGLAFTSVQRVGSVTSAAWDANPGTRYQVQYKNTLDDAKWTDLAGEVTATGSTASFEDSSSDTTRFYRIFALP